MTINILSKNIKFVDNSTIKQGKIKDKTRFDKHGKKYLIALDLDGTFLNGNKADRELFLSFVNQKDHKLIYVSGRLRNELNYIIKNYSIPLPDYFVAANGQYIYKKVNDRLVIDEEWNNIIHNNSFNKEEIEQTIENFNKNFSKNGEVALLKNDFKTTNYSIEYFINNKFKKDIKNNLKKFLQQNNINTRLIKDYKQPSDVANKLNTLSKNRQTKIKHLLDDEGGLYSIIFVVASKADAIEYLRNKLNIDKQHVITAGNSGNDISMTSHGWWFILVHNAVKMLKNHVDKLSPELKSTIIKVSNDGVVGIKEGVEKIYSTIG